MSTIGVRDYRLLIGGALVESASGEQSAAAAGSSLLPALADPGPQPEPRPELGIVPQADASASDERPSASADPSRNPVANGMPGE